MMMQRSVFSIKFLLPVTMLRNRTVSCKASADVDLPRRSWNQQKHRRSYQSHVTGAGNTLMAGIPSRFRVAGSGRDVILMIGGVQDEDAVKTLHFNSLGTWNETHFGGGTKLIVKTGVSVPPSVSLLPPSSEQLAAGQATLVCVLSGYSPQGATVSWTVDGTEVTEGVLTGEEVERDGGKSVRSSTLTLSKEEWQKRDLFTCQVSHDGGARSAELRRTQCGL